MGRIVRVMAVPAAGGYCVEDLAALQRAPIAPGDRYTAAAVTPGFRAVRQAAEAVSVGLVLDDGRVAWGDCVGVTYAGQAGRAPALNAAAGLETIARTVAPFLQGRELGSFRELAGSLEQLREPAAVPAPLPERDPAQLSRRELLAAPARMWRAAQGQDEPRDWITVEQPLHPALRYGLSQALLRAVALVRGLSMAEVTAAEWGLPRPQEPVPIHAQCGAERYHNADKMIAHRVASLPHALVDDIPAQLGQDGSKLAQYVRWLQGRIRLLGGADYRPTIHLDVHGTLGRIHGHNLGRVLGELVALEAAAGPYPLRVESPVLLESREAQVAALRTLRDYVRSRQMHVRLVADEWANTLEDIQCFIQAGAADMIHIKMPDLGGVHQSVEAVLACQAGGVGALLGGSCAETDLSAQVAVHLALATRPDLLLARPGLGVDEALMITQNEMARALAEIKAAETR